MISDGQNYGNISKVKSVLTLSEQAFYLELKRQVNLNKFHIFVKLRLIDVVRNKNEADQVKYGLMRKHIDFIITNFYFEPIIAIEVDGWSHKLEHVKKSDSFKESIMYMVDMPLVRVKVGSNFKNLIKNIVSKYKLT